MLFASYIAVNSFAQYSSEITAGNGSWSGHPVQPPSQASSSFAQLPSACGITSSQWSTDTSNAFNLSAAANRFYMKGFNCTSYADAVNNLDFALCQITTDAMTTLTIDSFILQLYRSSAGSPDSFQLEYSTGGAFINIGSFSISGGNGYTIQPFENLNIVLPPSSSITFRLVIWGAQLYGNALAIRDGTGFRGHVERNCNLTAAFSDSGLLCVNDDTWNVAINGTPGASVFYRMHVAGEPYLSGSITLDSAGTSGLGSPPDASISNTPVVIKLDSIGLSCCGSSLLNDSIIIGRYADPSVSISSISPVSPQCANTPVSFTATEVNGGLSPVYQWYENDMLMPGEMSALFNAQNLIPGDNSIKVLMTHDYVCPLGAATDSATVTYHIHFPANAGSISGNDTICTGEGSSLIADGNAGGTWSSSNNNIAAIDNTGLLNGIAAGTVMIQYTSISECNTDTAFLPVTVLAPELPLFTPVPPICPGAELAVFPEVALNNIMGTWFPEPDNMNTTTYIFTADPGQCAANGSMEVAVLPITYGAETAVICQGQAYSFNDNFYWENNNTATDTFTSEDGCDSIITLNLIVLPTIADTINPQICSGQSFSFNGIAYSESVSGITAIFQNAEGCDSVVTMNLTILPALVGIETALICQGQAYAFNDNFYTENNNIATDTFTSAGGCDSIVTLNLTVLPIIADTINPQICSGQSFSFNGIAYSGSVSGITAIFQNAEGCDSVVTMNLTVLPAIRGIENAVICQGQAYAFNDNSYWENNNTATDTFTSAGGCDSIVTLNLIVLPSIADTINPQICSGQSFSFNGIAYSESVSGITAIFQNAEGCDSVVTMNLTVLPTISSTINPQICSGQSFSFNGITYSESVSGITATFQNAEGCDSVLMMNLTVLSALSGIENATICQGQTYSFNDNFYWENNNTATDTFTSTGGCDSIVTLNLIVLPVITDTINPQICSGQSFSFNGITYSESVSGITAIFQNAEGCDSVLMMNLTVLPALSGTETAVICQGQAYSFNDSFFSENNNTATDTFTSEGGCDSIITLNLAVLPIITDTINPQICSGQSFSFNGIAYSESISGITATFQNEEGCDSVVTMNLTVLPTISGPLNPQICNGQSFSFNGIIYSESVSGITATFQNAAGCDSIVTMNLTVLPALSGTETAVICQGQAYSFNDSFFSENNNTATDTFTSEGGCDSIVTLNLTVLPTITDTINPQICNGQSFSFNGIAYSEPVSGITAIFQNAAGCDSIVTMNLTVLPALSGTETAVICQGQAYSFNDNFYWENNNTATDTFTSEGGCDSIVTLNLAVLPIITDTINPQICSGQSFLFNDVEYSESVSGITTTFQNAAGCDSMVTMNLAVIPALSGVENAVICQGQTYGFNDNFYTENNNTATDTFTSAGGCDSIVTLNLTVLPTITDTINPQICSGQSFSFNGTEYSESVSGISAIFQNAEGCDSVVTMNLTVKPIAQTLSFTFEACDSYFFEGVDYMESTTLYHVFRDVDSCDSVIRTVDIIINHSAFDTIRAAICMGEVYPFNGTNYTTTGKYDYTTPGDNGCDATITLDLKVHPLPNIDLFVNTVSAAHGFCIGDSVTIAATGALNYTWENGYGQLLGTGDSITMVLPELQNMVKVTGVDTNGCVDTAGIVIGSEPCCVLLMPNAFSPNGDHINDHFGPVTYGHPVHYQFQIFNRWGQCIFISFRAEDQWDGIVNGQPAPVGTYHYRIRGKCISGAEINQNGAFILLR